MQETLRSRKAPNFALTRRMQQLLRWSGQERGLSKTLYGSEAYNARRGNKRVKNEARVAPIRKGSL